MTSRGPSRPALFGPLFGLRLSFLFLPDKSLSCLFLGLQARLFFGALTLFFKFRAFVRLIPFGLQLGLFLGTPRRFNLGTQPGL